MGMACVKALPTEHEDILGRRAKKNQLKQQQAVKDEADLDEAGAATPRAQKPKKREEPNLIADILKRAKAGSEQDRLAAALAAAPDAADENSSSGGEQEAGGPSLELLLGGPASESYSSAARPKVLAPPAGRAPHGSLSTASRLPQAVESLKALGHSERIVRAAARLGVPLPSTKEEDEKYGFIDEYIDDLLGVPPSKRPADWKRPTASETEAALRGLPPSIIYEDGRHGPPREVIMRPREYEHEYLQDKKLAQVLETDVQVPTSGRPSLTGRPSLLGGQRSTLGGQEVPDYLSAVINGWATIDAEAPGGDGAPSAADARLLPPLDREDEPATDARPLPRQAASGSGLRPRVDVAERVLADDGRPAPKRKAQARPA